MKVLRYKRSRVYRGIGLSHAHKDGGPVLLGHASWRTVNGIFFNSRRTGSVWVLFRRTGGK